MARVVVSLRAKSRLTVPMWSQEAGTATVQAVQDITIQATHVYTQAGTYVVTVAATNDAGTVVAAQEITVEVPTAEPPVAAPQRPGELYLPYMNR